MARQRNMRRKSPVEETPLRDMRSCDTVSCECGKEEISAPCVRCGGTMKIMAIDPSGNFKEGNGTTGFVKYETGKPLEFGSITTGSHERRVDYWTEIATEMLHYNPDLVILEDYRLYNTPNSPAAVQSFSQLETPRLVGILEYVAVNNKIKVHFQMANQTRPFSDEIMLKLGEYEKKGNRYYYKGQAINDHERSALRHLLVWLNKREIKI